MWRKRATHLRPPMPRRLRVAATAPPGTTRTARMLCTRAARTVGSSRPVTGVTDVTGVTAVTVRERLELLDPRGLSGAQGGVLRPRRARCGVLRRGAQAQTCAVRGGGAEAWCVNRGAGAGVRPRGEGRSGQPQKSPQAAAGHSSYPRVCPPARRRPETRPRRCRCPHGERPFRELAIELSTRPRASPPRLRRSVVPAAVGAGGR